MLIHGLDEDLKKELFKEFDVLDGVWIGAVYEMGDGFREVIPFQFAEFKYLAFFLSPWGESGDDEELLADSARNWANGCMPERCSRVVKFCRTDASEKYFDPENWSLTVEHQIWQFLETLEEVICLHTRLKPEIEQYFYLPSSEKLATAYKRIYRNIAKNRADPTFSLIPDTGEFYGYQKQL